MENPPRKITLRPESELATLLRRASRERRPLLVEAGEDLFRVDVSPTDSREAPSGAPASSSMSSKEAVMAFPGIWHDMDAERLIEDLKNARHAAPPSPLVQE